MNLCLIVWGTGDAGNGSEGKTGGQGRAERNMTEKNCNRNAKRKGKKEEREKKRERECEKEMTQQKRQNADRRREIEEKTFRRN